MGERSTEDGHQTVAVELMRGSPELLDRLARDRQEAIQYRAPALGAQRAGQLHRARDIDEHHRDLLAFAAHPRVLLHRLW